MKARIVVEEKGTKEGKGTVAGTEINLFPSFICFDGLFLCHMVRRGNMKVEKVPE